MNLQKTEILDYGNCVPRLFCRQDRAAGTGTTWYKADGAGELASVDAQGQRWDKQHSEASGSAPEVNHAVVHWNNTLFPGEASPVATLTGNQPGRMAPSGSADVPVGQCAIKQVMVPGDLCYWFRAQRQDMAAGTGIRLEGAAQAAENAHPPRRVTRRSEESLPFPQGADDFSICSFVCPEGTQLRDPYGARLRRTLSTLPRYGTFSVFQHFSLSAFSSLPSMRDLWVRLKYGDQAKVRSPSH